MIVKYTGPPVDRRDVALTLDKINNNCSVKGHDDAL